MPRALNADERAVLIFYCFDHVVAECARCRRGFREVELVTDYRSGHTHLCPVCNADQADSVRAHLYGCAMAPETVRRKAKAARDTARRLVTQSRQLMDKADLLSREAEALLDSARPRGTPPARHTIPYRGWQIEPQSYRCARERWCPKASVTARDRTVHTPLGLTRTFANREEADAYAVATGKDLIDDLLA